MPADEDVKDLEQKSEIPNRLKSIREGTGLGSREFADRVAAAGYAVTYATVTEYETGKVGKIPADFLAAVCRAFGVSPGYVLAITDDPHPPSATAAEEALVEIEAAILRARSREKPTDPAPPPAAASGLRGRTPEQLQVMEDSDHIRAAEQAERAAARRRRKSQGKRESES